MMECWIETTKIAKTECNENVTIKCAWVTQQLIMQAQIPGCASVRPATVYRSV